MRSGTVVEDRHGQEWVAFRAVYAHGRAQIWWMPVDPIELTRPSAPRERTARDGTRLDDLIQTCGPLRIRAVPRGLSGILRSR